MEPSMTRSAHKVLSHMKNLLFKRLHPLLVSVLALGALTLSPTGGHALVTPFGERVNEAINLGLQWLRDAQNDDGGWGRPTQWRCAPLYGRDLGGIAG